jgi:hypothetical protein
VVLTEWGLTPEYVNENWTEELLHLMLKSRAKRFNGVVAEAPKRTGRSGVNHISSADLLAKMKASGSGVALKTVG